MIIEGIGDVLFQDTVGVECSSPTTLVIYLNYSHDCS